MGVADQYIKSTIRLPEDLHEELMSVARKHERSVNSQMIYILREYCKAEKKKDKK